MTDNNARKPAAFRLDQPEQIVDPQKARAPQQRRPTAIKDVAVITPAAVDVFDLDPETANELDALTPPPALAQKKRFSFASLLTGALGVLVSLALGLWADNLIRTLFERAPWLGWVALGVSVVAAFALIAIVLREGLALRRLASVQHLRDEAAKAAADNDARAAKAAVGKLVSIAETLPATAKGRALLHDLRDDVIDGRDLIRLTETELLRPLDRQAREMILAASKRVSIVTAVSPRALVDIGYVVFESSASDPAAFGTLWRPAGHAWLPQADAQCHRASRRHRHGGDGRQHHPAAGWPRSGGTAFRAARRRRHQWTDDCAHRHLGHGPRTALPVQCGKATEYRRFHRRSGTYWWCEEG